MISLVYIRYLQCEFPHAEGGVEVESPLLAAVAEDRPSIQHRGLLLHQDNAAAQRAAAMNKLLQVERIQQLEQPSSVLAWPCVTSSRSLWCIQSSVG